MPDITTTDKEILACADAFAALEPLSSEERERVLAYLVTRLLPGGKISADPTGRVSWTSLAMGVADALGDIQSKDEALEELASRLERAEARFEGAS